MLDDREDVEDVVWTDGGFILVVEQVVSQSQLAWGSELTDLVFLLVKYFSGFSLAITTWCVSDYY